MCGRKLQLHFNPLPPHGGRRLGRRTWGVAEIISIHSLRMEGDVLLNSNRNMYLHFNPLPPHGGRQSPIWSGDRKVSISIHSLRMEGDSPVGGCKTLIDISIHSLRMEGDICCKMALWVYVVFQSTPSAWRETIRPLTPTALQSISIHSLRMEGDNCKIRRSGYTHHFNPLPPHGGRPVSY